MAGTPNDILKHSVTKGDAVAVDAGGAVPWVIPLLPIFSWARLRIMPPGLLPVYWTPERDLFLRSTYYAESKWSQAIGIAVSKQASKSFNIRGPKSTSAREMEMLQLMGGATWVPEFSKFVQDFLTTCNGTWGEIVRVSKSSGSRILGIRHLDSLRCRRTGDPNIPLLYQDLRGVWHELKAHQVFNLTDMPDPSSGYFGVGHPAAEKAYDAIYRMAVIEQYVGEKSGGTSPNKLVFVRGMKTDALQRMLQEGELQATQKGMLYYMGSLLMGLQSDDGISVEEVMLRGLPENFDLQAERRSAQIEYANAIGLDPFELVEPKGGLGTGSQTFVLHEKAQGRGLAAFDKAWAIIMNLAVVSNRTTFTWSDKDPIDEQRKAQVAKLRADTRQVQVTTGEITPDQSLQMAVDSEDAPAAFLEVDETDITTITDEDNADVDEAAQSEPSPIEVTTAQPELVEPIEELAKSVEKAMARLIHEGAL